MSVISLWFLLLLAAAVPLFYRTSPQNRWRVLLAVSVVFYLAQAPWGFLVLALAALFCWRIARKITPGGSKGWLWLGVGGCIGALVICKYLPAGFPAMEQHWLAQKLLVPLGLSYFTLELISYLVDVYRGVCPAEESYWRLLTFAGFFATVTQGPFARYDRLMPQLSRETRLDWTRVKLGVQRMLWGYFLKFAGANRLAQPVDKIFKFYSGCNSPQLILGVVLYSFQLYLDFCGYTHIVLGAAELFGLELPENFRQPYLAVDCRDFWRRWHQSLSGWLRDYVYIPLGGSRCSALRKKFNLLVTFAISGVWHGVGLQFLFWGVLNGLFQVAGSLTEPLRRRLPRIRGLHRVWQSVGTFFCIAFAWLFFRSPDMQTALEILGRICRLDSFAHPQLMWAFDNRIDVLYLGWIMLLVLAVDLLHETGHHLRAEINALHPVPKMLIYLVLFWTLALTGIFVTTTGAFLYARF